MRVKLEHLKKQVEAKTKSNKRLAAKLDELKLSKYNLTNIVLNSRGRVGTGPPVEGKRVAHVFGGGALGNESEQLYNTRRAAIEGNRSMSTVNLNKQRLMDKVL